MIVRAIHAYNPVNNDELKLCKNDLITVTQKDEGGWWEGTLNGKTGWFPSNFVVEVDDLSSLEVISNGNSTTTSLVSLEINNPQRNEYRRMIVSEWIESENAHIMELQGMWENYLQPLRTSDILKTAEYEILIGSMAEILQFHTNMLLQIKKEQTKPPNDQRIGKIFLDNGSKMEIIHKQYCSNHPKAVQIIDKHTDVLKEFMESKGAQKPGVLVLVVALSQPFRRLEKYPCMLQELERHIEESHKDRGDLQRSIEFYKQIGKSCSVLRKQKEMELEVLNGTIKGWEGTDVSNLGEILYMNLVHVGFDLQPRYFVLFANTLLILTYDTDTNSLSYEGKLPISGILLTDVPDKDNVVNAFEIAGPMLEPILVRCSSTEVKQMWLEHLTRILKLNRFPSLYYSPQQVHHFIIDQDVLSGMLEASLVCSSYLNYFSGLLCQGLQRQLVDSEIKNVLYKPSVHTFILKYGKRQSFRFKYPINDNNSFTDIIMQICSNKVYRQRPPYNVLTSLVPSSTQRTILLNMDVNNCEGPFNDLIHRSHRSHTFSVNDFFSETQSCRCKLPQHRSSIHSEFLNNNDSQDKPKNKRGFLVRQDAFDFGDENILDENQNYL